MEAKFLIFSIGAEHYGIPITHVREIIRHDTITPIHDVIPCVRGVINLRGKIITIFDTRERFGFETREYDKYTVFIICEVQSATHQLFTIGLAVDAVHQVESIDESEIKLATDLGLSISSEYLLGVVRGTQGLTQLLEIDRVVQGMTGREISGSIQALGAGAQ